MRVAGRRRVVGDPVDQLVRHGDTFEGESDVRGQTVDELARPVTPLAGVGAGRVGTRPVRHGERLRRRREHGRRIRAVDGERDWHAERGARRGLARSAAAVLGSPRLIVTVTGFRPRPVPGARVTASPNSEVWVASNPRLGRFPGRGDGTALYMRFLTLPPPAPPLPPDPPGGAAAAGTAKARAATAAAAKAVAVRREVGLTRLPR